MEELQFYQVWDYVRNQPQSFHLEKVFAEEEAARLNSNTAVDWNGLKRFHVIEAND